MLHKTVQSFSPSATHPQKTKSELILSELATLITDFMLSSARKTEKTSLLTDEVVKRLSSQRSRRMIGKEVTRVTQALPEEGQKHLTKVRLKSVAL